MSGFWKEMMREEMRRSDEDFIRALRSLGHLMRRDPHPDAIEAEYVEHSNAPTPLLPAKVGEDGKV